MSGYLREKSLVFFVAAICIIVEASLGILSCSRNLTILNALGPFIIVAISFSTLHAAEKLRSEQRVILSELACYLSICISCFGALLTELMMPLTYFIDPSVISEAKRSISNQEILNERLIFLVKSVYSIFDSLTLIGTFATLSLVILGAIIPEETKRINAKEEKASRENILKRKIASYFRAQVDETVVFYTKHPVLHYDDSAPEIIELKESMKREFQKINADALDLELIMGNSKRSTELTKLVGDFSDRINLSIDFSDIIHTPPKPMSDDLLNAFCRRLNGI